MRDHIRSILHTAAIFGAVGALFTAISATRHWAAEEKHLSAETAFFDAQVEEKRLRMEAARYGINETLKKIQQTGADELAKQREEQVRKAEEERVSLILKKMEVGRRICLGAHEESWWFLCEIKDAKGQIISEEPCEKTTYVCDGWAAKKGLELKGEKVWGK
jgi:hypothetical protein